MSENRNREQRESARLRRGIEYLVENGADEQQPERVQQSHQRHRDDGGEQVKPIGLEIPE